MATNAQKIRTANMVMIVAGAAMVATLAYDRFVPQPTQQMSPTARNENISKINREKHDAMDREMAELDYVKSKTWTVDVEQIGPKVLSIATDVAKGHGLTVTAFRPQRTVEDGKLLRVPFLATIDGSYPQVAAFLRSMEDSSGNVAITMVQLSSSDGVSDQVTATIGLMVLKEPVKPPPPAKTEPAKTEPAKTASGSKNDSGDSHV